MEEKGREQELSVREISLIRELTQIRKEHKRELEYEKFDGYELPPRTQFSMLNTVHSGVAGSKWSGGRKRPSV